jgi:hypothetical protein
MLDAALPFAPGEQSFAPAARSSAGHRDRRRIPPTGTRS